MGLLDNILGTVPLVKEVKLKDYKSKKRRKR